MHDTLLFLHVLAAFALGASVVVQLAFAFGAELDSSAFRLFDVTFNAGGAGTLIFGVWLALYVAGYELWDGWILGAIVLWALSYEAGRRARLELRAAVVPSGGAAAAAGARVATWSWLYALLVVLLLADMVVKPGT